MLSQKKEFRDKMDAMQEKYDKMEVDENEMAKMMDEAIAEYK